MVVLIESEMQQIECEDSQVRALDPEDKTVIEMEYEVDNDFHVDDGDGDDDEKRLLDRQLTFANFVNNS